jgi:radical SAM superfamily enzyme YgiQ (UPF0313 family)
MNHGLIFSSRLHAWERSSGAHRIATYLRQHEMDIEVVDFAAHWELELLKEFTRKSVKSTTLFFGFSIFFSYWNVNMVMFSEWLKKEYPNIKIIAGGQSILDSDCTYIDIWVDSYGEEAMLEVVKSLAGNTTAGIKFSAEHFGTKKVIKCLESYPSHNLKDYGNIYEARDYLESWEWLTIEFARGCKFSCAFCNFPILGLKEDNSRSQESVERELKYNYDNFGIDRYYAADETFNDRLEKITKFADVVEKLDFNPFFSGFIRADLLQNQGMTEELARMNFGGQYYGVETFNKKSGVVIGKGLDPDKVKSLILDARSFFYHANKRYRGTISLIAGLPYDNIEQWDNNREWLATNWRSEAFSVYPLGIGTSETSNQSKFSKNLKKYGLREMAAPADTDRWSMEYWRNPNYARTEVLWEHDSMNIFQAREIAKEFQDISLTYPLDNWTLSTVEVYAQQKIPDLSKLLNRKKGWGSPNAETCATFIKNYSLKKLK